jgi:hypothetical protein
MRTRTKTALCIDWLRAREGGTKPPADAPNDWGCPRGQYCEFAHGEEELRGIEKERVEEKKQQAYEDKKTKTKDSYMKPLYEGMKSDIAINDMVLQGLRQASKKSKLTKDKAVPTSAYASFTSNEKSKIAETVASSSSTTTADSTPVSQPPAVVSREFVSLASGQIIVEKGVEEGIVVLTGNSKFATAILTFNKNSPGVYYFEIELLSDGLMQLGWIDDEFQDSANDKEGEGIGDDTNGHSWAFDGFRNKLLHKGEEISLPIASSSSSTAGKDNKETKGESKEKESWETNDVVGCLLKIEEMSSSSSSANKNASKKKKEVHLIFYLNGNRVSGGEFQFSVESNHSGFYPAISLEEGESVVINNGEKVPFKFPPEEEFSSFLPLCSHTC